MQDFKVAVATCLNFFVTSSLLLFITLVFPSITALPSSLIISDGSRGVDSPPNCSGQTIINCLSLRYSATFSFLLLSPLYLQFIPSKHADTSITSITLLVLIYFSVTIVTPAPPSPY